MGELSRLRVQLEEQQKQIEQLRTLLESQKRMLDQLVAAASTPAGPVRRQASLGEIASTVPMVPAARPSTAAPVSAGASSQSLGVAEAAPLQIKVGDTTIMPVGFLDATAVWRDKNAGSGIGSSFGSIPFNNVTAGKLSEFRFSPQNSRIGFRIDGAWKGVRFLAYHESDFLGASASNNLGVTNGGFVPRLRLFWVDVRKGQWEMLAGQSWSLLTPNRKGLSAIPGDLFFSQVVDVNYMVGLTWTRQPGVRVLYHPSDRVTVGLSLENPNQYIGGSAGGGPVVLPAALMGLAGSQLDNSSNVLVTPNVHPDIIAKVAFDPSARVHVEVAGIERTFKVWNPSSGRSFTKAGAGGSINANFEVAKNFRLVTNNYWSNGGGRYLFGQAPDVVVRADGSLSPIHAGGTVDGFEAVVNQNTLLYSYYGAIYIGRNVAADSNGASLVGYGFRGSANNQNRTIQEVTFGLNQTLWKDARYGALNLMAQYEYAFRNPWYVAPNAPRNAHDNTIYVNLRYSLPGGPPALK